MLIESASLQALGFAPAEIFLARLASGRLVVPVQLGEEQVYFLIDTGIREAVVLSLPFAESRGFLVLGRQRLAARRSGQPQVEVADVICPPFEALGRRRSEWQVSAYAGQRYRLLSEYIDCQPIAGSFGLEFFADGVLGLDFRHPAVALTDQLPTIDTHLPVEYDLSVSPVGGLVFLEGIRDAVTERPLRLYFDSGVLTSGVAYDTTAARVPNKGLLNRLLRVVLQWHHRRNVRRRQGLVQWPFTIGGQRERQLDVSLVSSLRGMAAGYDLDRVDGWIGTELVQNSIVVTDFSSMRFRVFLPPVGGAAPEA